MHPLGCGGQKIKQGFEVILKKTQGFVARPTPAGNPNPIRVRGAKKSKVLFAFDFNVGKLLRYLLTDPRLFGILQFGPGW
jgi:hypothetical protein